MLCAFGVIFYDLYYSFVLKINLKSYSASSGSGVFVASTKAPSSEAMGTNRHMGSYHKPRGVGGWSASQRITPIQTRQRHRSTISHDTHTYKHTHALHKAIYLAASGRKVSMPTQSTVFEWPFKVSSHSWRSKFQYFKLLSSVPARVVYQSLSPRQMS